MSQFYTLQLMNIERDTPESMILTLVVQDEHQHLFRHMAGQYLTLRTFLNGEEVRRSYSLCHAPDSPWLQISIKKVAGGCFSQWAHTNLKPGDYLEALPPAGSFVLPVATGAERHYVGFAAGSGITPVLSILQTVLQQEVNSRFTLVYSNHNLASMQFRELLAILKDLYLTRLSLIYLFSAEIHDIDLLNGRLDYERCSALLNGYVPINTIDYAWICGPSGMMKEVKAALIAGELPESQIRTEWYGMAQVSSRKSTPDPQADNFYLTVTLEDTQYQIELSEPTDSLLDALLEAGLNPRYSCKAGICATCRCRVLSGEVEMDEPHALAPEEVNAGYILSCCSRPLTPRVTLLFD
ncbi:phenylacetic acid degradation protein [Photorhabdus luminescens]|uniref:2Fe-2S iron-sulfur cluster-binding protein n=1 Tax=Photorhabdus akhurstii TaxID=171438 RepID=UPI000CF8C59F|nr:phenylacetic acid degradation protein [Photorhabdus luminescens]PQQ34047.1 phenylacetic acid degradation protein [Photorhabdus luminescens]